MDHTRTAQVRPWIGDPPQAEPPDVPGYVQVAHARVDMLRLSIAGVLLLPLWWFVFGGLSQIISGSEGFSITVGLTEIVLAAFIAMVAVPAVHEAAHGLTAHLLGARPAYGVGAGYAYTTFREPMGRVAYLAIGLAPLVVISALGMLLVAAWPAALGWLVFACIVNAAGAIGDLWMAWCILRLPRRAIFFDLADGFAAFVPANLVSQRPAEHPPVATD